MRPVRKLWSFSSVLLSVFMMIGLLFPSFTVRSEDPPPVVRVGWYESPYNQTDSFGRRSGYAYDYEQKIAAYTGWTYEYVEGSWSQLMEMLRNGEIDLMSDVSYTPERTEHMLYASLPMGNEAYYIFISSDNTSISVKDYSTMNGKKVGIPRGSIQEEYLLQWEKRYGVQVQLIELDGTDRESLQLLKEGEIDAYVTMDFFGDPGSLTPVCKVGSSDFYFAVNKNRPDLLADLDIAMNRIQDENKYYNLQLHELYLSNPAIETYLTADEEAWLSEHGPIRVGYQDGYLAFCASDDNGELTGALKDYLAYAEHSLETDQLSFEAIAYPTAAAAMEALKAGEVDCMFPANLKAHDSEALDLVMTAPLMTTEMDAVVRASEQKEFIRKPDVTVAVNEGNTNYEQFLLEHYPGWKIAYFTDTPTGLKAVAEGKADCVIISNYRFSNISKLCENLQLSTIYTGVDMDYYFALPRGETELYSILSRVIRAVPSSVTNTSLTYYSTEDVKTSMFDLLMDNLLIVMSITSAVLFIILMLVLRSVRAERKIREEEHLVNDLNQRVFVDPLTGIRNKGSYDEHIAELQKKLDADKTTQFAIGVFDCDDLKQINDQYGHDKGNVYLKHASRLICSVFDHSPVFRIGGDEFTTILQNQDFENREDLMRRFESERREICRTAGSPWDEVHIALGIAVYDPENDHSVHDTVRRADRNMYENKRRQKKQRSSSRHLSE